MFITEFVLDTAQLSFQPDEEEFQDKIAEVIKQFQVGPWHSLRFLALVYIVLTLYYFVVINILMYYKYIIFF